MSRAAPLESLKRAVALIGSQSATGHLLGVSQASVWKWLREGKPLPAQHVLAIEAATGISRHELRPDLYPDERTPADAVFDRRTPGAGHSDLRDLEAAR